MLPPRRATRGTAPPLSQYFPAHAPPRPPRLHDRVDVLWEDRGVYFRGTLAHRVKKKKRAFHIRYDDGDWQETDLDNFHWRYADDHDGTTHGDHVHVHVHEHELKHGQRVVDALEFIPDRSESVSALSDARRAAPRAPTGTDGDVSASTQTAVESSLCETSVAGEYAGGAASVVSPVSITQRAVSPKPLLLGACVKAGGRAGFVLPPPRTWGKGGKDWKRRVMEKFLKQEMMQND